MGHLKTQGTVKHTWFMGSKMQAVIICSVNTTLRAAWLLGWSGIRRHGGRFVEAFKKAVMGLLMEIKNTGQT